ncbi:beta-ketoacyl-ACP synthase III [Anaeromicrobium sediminis]|uniref:Beta-ketoacyl-[acyl-carrier-protein] synthase III n=1 Tax=Anaeromicrobium sediminis TaxID=1478221 RepID=A0A267MJC3_9FIRM|nr:beta-ketoacyl-ACP synthase III [Anaeromicrobium sediminis]PAB58890.1 3-oxoacyl-ACP synthase [Anaeromicrobium sediminis]
MENKLISAGILGLGSYVPEKIVTNDDIAKMVDTSHDWIVSRTGIEERRVVSEGQSTSDISAIAAKRALEDANLSPEDIDLIIVATLTPDMLIPSTACIVQSKIGAKNAAAFDLEAACSGFVYGLTVARQFVATGMYKNILVIGAEVLSKFLDWEDRNTCILFGDGAGAAVVGPVEDGKGILSMTMGADGTGGESLLIPAGGATMPASEQTIADRLHYIRMDGSEVFKFAVRTMGRASIEVIEKAGHKVEDIDFLVPHQANIRIVNSAAKKLKLSNDKFYVNLNKYGNMSGASIPVALDEAVKLGKIKKDDLVVLVGFGAGLTWGSCLIKWNK